MTDRSPKPAFDGRLFFSVIAAFPVVFVLFKYTLWETYGVFDFYTFHLAGVLANAGNVEQLYQPNAFAGQFSALYGESGQLPWFYPPLLIPYCQFLALFSVSFAFLVNGFLSIAAYYLVIKLVFPHRFREIINLSALPIIIALGFGHPVVIFLSLLIIGYKLAHLSHGGALLALTLGAAKPHLGGVAVFLLFLRGRQKSLWPSAIIFIGMIAGFSMVYSWTIWWLFLQNIGTAASFVDSGTINQQWISSAFSVALGAGASTVIAGIVHLTVLALLAGSSLYLFRHEHELKFWVTTGIIVTFSSPYLMYYDIIYLLFPLALVINRMNLTKARNWTYAIFIGEILLVAILSLETLGGLGFFAFLLFTAALLFGGAWFLDGAGAAAISQTPAQPARPQSPPQT